MAWPADRVMADVVELPLPAHAAPGPAEIVVGIYPEGRPDERLPVSRGGEPIGGSVRLTGLTIGSRS